MKEGDSAKSISASEEGPSTKTVAEVVPSASDTAESIPSAATADVTTTSVGDTGAGDATKSVAASETSSIAPEIRLFLLDFNANRPSNEILPLGFP